MGSSVDRKEYGAGDMRALQPAQLCPTAIKTAYLSSACSTLLLCKIEQHVVCIVGKANGQIVLFPIDRLGAVSRIDEFEAPISAFAVGDVRHCGRAELVAIAADGWLRSFIVPTPADGDSSMPPAGGIGACETFAQLLNANICAAHLVDIDGDNRLEMIVAMSDRVVRTYRFLPSEGGQGRMTPLNKWEVPTQITSMAIGVGMTVHALLSQSCAHYVRLEFGQKDDVSFVQSMATDSPDAAHLFLPLDVSRISVFHALPCRLIVVDAACNSETQLKPSGGPLVSAACVSLTPSDLVLVTVDLTGLLSFYEWSDLVSRTDPIGRCQIMTNVEHLSAVSAGTDGIYVAVVSVYFELALYHVRLGSVLQLTGSK